MPIYTIRVGDFSDAEQYTKVAIIVKLIVGLLVDRFNKLAVLGGIFTLLAIASSSLTIEDSSPSVTLR
jgi:hypothetical protein